MYCHYELRVEKSSWRTSCTDNILDAISDTVEVVGVSALFVLLGLLANSASAALKGWVCM